MKKWWKMFLCAALAVLAVCPAALAADAGEETQDLVSFTVDASDHVFMFGAFQGPQTLPWEAELYDEESPETKTYNKIYQAILKQETSVDVYDCKIATDALADVFFKVLNDHPELFYVDNHFNGSGMGGYGYSVDITYLYTNLIGTFEKKVDEILAEVVDEGMTPLQKLLVLHDYIVLNCRYDYDVGNKQGEGTRHAHDAYGALVEGNAVCQGYAEAYMLLLQRSGFQGKVGLVDSEAMTHVWNWVELNDEYYHIDATWDDPLMGNPYGRDFPGYCEHHFFLRSNVGLERHDGYDPKFNFTETTYEDGYIFSDSETAFFWYEGEIYYVDDNVVRKADNAALTGPTVNEKYKEEGEQYGWLQQIVIRQGDDLFFLNNSHYINYEMPVYHYSFRTGKTKPLYTHQDFSSAYGLLIYNGCLNLVQLSGNNTLNLLKAIDFPEEEPDWSTAYYDLFVESKRLLQINVKDTAATVYVARYNADDTFVDVQLITGSGTCQLEDGQSAKIMALGSNFAPLCEAHSP